MQKALSKPVEIVVEIHLICRVLCLSNQ